ncbi:Uncharacterized protein HZ326_23735 [Fusarium oxysporum f. sp. albedinis]|nr:Uncharacterized protein HZ326_23735 [Fusarium oxysporum f. sp. albedinis]
MIITPVDLSISPCGRFKWLCTFRAGRWDLTGRGSRFEGRIGVGDLARGVFERGDRVNMLNSLVPIILHPTSAGIQKRQTLTMGVKA